MTTTVPPDFVGDKRRLSMNPVSRVEELLSHRETPIAHCPC